MVYQKTVQILFIAGILSLFFVSESAAGEKNFFKEGNLKYQSGDFEEAARLYEAAIQQGQTTSAGYYNLGNAYYRLGKKGKALIAYERAFRGAPRDRDLRWNMAILKSSFQDHMDEGSPANPVTWFRYIGDPFIPDEITLALTTVLVILLLVLLINLFAPNSARYSRGIYTILIIMLMLLSALIAVKWADTKDPWIVIIDNKVHARYGPSEKETSAFLVHEGAKLKATDQSRGWVYVVINNKQSGWIPKQSCEFI